MHELFTVRSARAADADELTRLARLSKAHWGYPKEWLDVWQNDLTISPETIEGAIGYVAESGESIIGFWIRASLNSDRQRLDGCSFIPITWVRASPVRCGNQFGPRPLREESSAL